MPLGWWLARRAWTRNVTVSMVFVRTSGRGGPTDGPKEFFLSLASTLPAWTAKTGVFTVLARSSGREMHAPDTVLGATSPPVGRGRVRPLPHHGSDLHNRVTTRDRLAWRGEKRRTLSEATWFRFLSEWGSNPTTFGFEPVRRVQSAPTETGIGWGGNRNTAVPYDDERRTRRIEADAKHQDEPHDARFQTLVVEPIGGREKHEDGRDSQTDGPVLRDATRVRGRKPTSDWPRGPTRRGSQTKIEALRTRRNERKRCIFI